MAKRILGLFLAALLSVSTTALSEPFSGQISSSPDEVLAKNLSSAGGADKLASVKNFSFQTGPMTYFLSPDGRMKITSGDAPIITEVILVDEFSAKRNCFNNVTELPPRLQATHKALALLRSGMFTLKNFKDMIDYQGLKKFGATSHHMFTTQVGRLNVYFYLDPEECLLRRLVIKGYDPGQGTYEINHDYAGYQDFEGIRIPTTWFSSQVGTRGNQLRVSHVKFNQDLAADFFNQADVNVGDVKISSGSLGGNIINVSFRRNMLTIGTNWTQTCIEGAGFSSGDKLLLIIRDRSFPIDFYSEAASRTAYQAGARFMAPNQQDENYIILMLGPENSRLAEELEPLLPIKIQKQ